MWTVRALGQELRPCAALVRWSSSSAEIVRNEVGVQLLNRHLHRQIFKKSQLLPADPRAIVIAREHLRMHGLDPSKASVVPDIGFDLPSLQGESIDEHFHRIGTEAAEPWSSLAKELCSHKLPPPPALWKHVAGWTKYSSDTDPEPVACPDEQALVFDVETLPRYSQYPIIAVAASTNAWYCWVSPWLLGLSDSPDHLVPLGDPDTPKVVIGHNVAYDRARVMEEYSFNATRTRFIDTMALHIAVKGMSSGQRPVWMKYNKQREEQERLSSADQPSDPDEDLSTRLSLEDDVDREEFADTRWEKITSANSLLHVARLHCGIKMDKTVRDDLLTTTPQEVVNALGRYIEYCARDVQTTHAVFRSVLPKFLSSCPSPVSFAGALTMGSGFLPVDQSWLEYLQNSEETFGRLDASIKAKLADLAEDARRKMHDESWRDDQWLSQLDWMPKKPKRRRLTVHREVPIVDTNRRRSFMPRWYCDLRKFGFDGKTKTIVGHLLSLSYNGCPVIYSRDFGWHYLSDGEIGSIPRRSSRKGAVRSLFSRDLIQLTAKPSTKLLYDCLRSDLPSKFTWRAILRLALRTIAACRRDILLNQRDPWLKQLDWAILDAHPETNTAQTEDEHQLVPKWYWAQMKAEKDADSISMEVTVRSRIAPLLLRLKWEGFPLFYSREHGWTFRVPKEENYTTTRCCLHFSLDEDSALQVGSASGAFKFYKLPHKDGESANVGNPLSKSFVSAAQTGILTSPEKAAMEALDMNAQCSYWISARDRVLNQMVVWNGDSGVNLESPATAHEKRLGLILPQVVTMGTITRRAMEKTWLTASNAKINRVGSELKAMVRAPPGYCFVGADVDSEELWISSVMGDAQFGIHGASAIGWMTLEGTKAAKSDLHSKTAAILGITRDAAKIFNYSRIYGAGMRHAQLLLLQNSPNMQPDMAKKLATELYMATKGKKLNNDAYFGRRFWYGGSESFVFNTLEDIASSSWPKTPALGCGITTALKKQHLPANFGSDYLPSRINWAVQSSGVDYLHLLIVAMEYLIRFYQLRARYLISVHDEIRFMVHEEDKYLVAFALQIANLWTRCQFAFKLGMDDLPQSVAFFSAVDVDHVLRKEPQMPCQTPSHTQKIEPGESLDMASILKRVQLSNPDPPDLPPLPYESPECMGHRCRSLEFLRAQVTDQLNEVKALSKEAKMH